ncbi:MAG TPA: hypothetical protein VJ347_19300, partial [Streptosporangiaceae bacterium]|nr:hypothetical protein [Streptosporangiaceae bacterium]
MTRALPIARDGAGVDLEAARRARCGPTRAAGRSSSRRLAYRTEHELPDRAERDRDMADPLTDL